MNIISLVVGKYASGKILHVYKNSQKKEIASDAQTITSKVKALRAKINERNKLKSDYGVWYVTRDQNQIVYAVCTAETYPQRQAYGLVQEVRSIMKGLCKGDVQKGNELQLQVQKKGKDIDKICAKYQDLKKVDKVRQAQAEVNDLESQLQTGIQKLIGNSERINNLDQKAGKMKLYAAQFEQKATVVEKTMFWNKWKCYLIMGSIVSAFLLTSGLIVYLRLH